NSGSDTISPIATATNTAGTPIAVGHSPRRVAITPNGATAYVTNISSRSVTPITTATNTAGTPISVGGQPYGIAIAQDPPGARKNPKCVRLRKKLRRWQQRKLARAGTEHKQAYIKANIKDTNRRLKKLGCK